ncbi:MAG: damage-inducible protein CinA [Gammaproteobacteria bacterium]|nr:MAG: damage-inducible protein CinA [Gammaproteobacteria bacterium]
MPAIQLLLTGNELMNGDIVDSNSSMIAKILLEQGLPLERKVTLGDELKTLSNEIESISQRADVLIVNGGLGPTSDDLTADALASAAGVKTTEHPDAMAHIIAWCKKRGFELSEPNRKQARLPQDCKVIPNPVGSAVGFHLTLNNCQIICTPGVPGELKKMMTETIVPLIISRHPGWTRYQTRRFQVFGLGEAKIQKLINEQLPDWPVDIEIGYRAALPFIDIKLTTASRVDTATVTKWLDKAKAVLGQHVIGDRGQSVTEIVIDRLRSQKMKLTTAESCTGGLIASQLTRIAGASDVFDAGFVTYSNAMKSAMLGVKPDTLDSYGAVSAEVVKEMAFGAINHSGADLAIAVSGIAGPSGGSEDKPIGTVWIAWGSLRQMNTCQLLIPGNREFFQKSVTAIAVDLIRRVLFDIDETPQYFLDQAPTAENTTICPAQIEET